MGTRIVILGAGFAGVMTAKKLAKRFKNKEDVKITLIDRHPYHTMLTEIHEVAAGRVGEENVRISLRRIFEGRRVDVILDTITSVNYDAKTLTGENGSYPYDYLVLASGSRPAFFGTPGAEKYAYRLWSYEDALKLRAHIIDVFQRAVSETDAAQRRSLLTFYIVGAGFTGVETAGELAEWVPILCDEFEISRDQVKLIDVDLLDRVVPVFPPEVAEKADRRLRRMGVQVELQTGVSALGEGYIELKKGDDVIRAHTDTVIWTAGVEGSEIAQKSGDTLKEVGRARIQTDDYLRAEGREDVYVAGDNIFYIPEGAKQPVPQMVENCEMSSETVDHNLGVDITGKGERERYRPRFHGAMLSVGGRYGVAYVGTEKSKISLASFFAMFVKHMVYIIYFVQILGFNKIFSYLRHEFFTIRNRRSFVGGHFSNRTPSFLLVPLRVFFGAFWVYEAAQKIGEKWLVSPQLAAYFKSAADVFNRVLKSPGGDVASTPTTASGVPTTTPPGTLIFNWNILGLFRVILINATDYAIKVQCGLMDWFNNTFLLRSNDSQMFFQYVVVLSELIIGVLLILGLFTFLSSGYSLVLQMIFLFSTGMYLATWWMIFTSIALLIGAGRTFGLDYYVMPELKRHWKNVHFVRKWYLYND